MGFFEFNTDISGPQLLPPPLRQTNFLAWLRVILSGVKYNFGLFFNGYINPPVYAGWGNLVAYTKGDRIVWTDKCVYEALKTHVSLIGANEPTGDADSATTWMKVLDIFIGADERVTYNAQIIKFEYQLNKFFMVPTSDPQIFINNNPPNSSVFVMGNTGQYSSSMVNDSLYATSWMGNAPTFAAFVGNFTINVPAALYATLGATPTDQENAIRQFADKYKLAGTSYNVVTF